MIPPMPPRALVDHLRQLDPALRLRWARHQELWVIEVKLPPRSPALMAERPNPVGSTPRAKDWWQGFREGYLFVTQMRHPIEYPWEFIAAHLKHLTLEAHRAKDALLDRLDAVEAAEDAAVDRAWTVKNEAAAHEIFDQMRWDQKRQISTHVEGENPRLIERDGYVVVDRRVHG